MLGGDFNGSDGVLVPDGTLKRNLKISDKALDYLKTKGPEVMRLRNILVIEDLLDLDDFNSGHVLVKNDAFLLDDVMYDLPFAHFRKPSSLPGCYDMPVLSFTAEDNHEIFSEVLDEFGATGRRRYIIRSSYTRESYIAEVDVSVGGLSVGFQPYMKIEMGSMLEDMGVQSSRFQNLLERIVSVD